MVSEDKTKGILKLLLRLLVTVSLLWFVLSRTNLQQLGQTIKTARWEFLMIAWVLVVLAFWIRAALMRVIFPFNADTQRLEVFIFHQKAALLISI